MVFSLFGKKQGLEALYQFVKQQLAKKSARKSKEGIATLFKDTDSVVQSNVKRIEEILKSHGYDASKMSANDILKAMNYHKALMDQRMNWKFESMGLKKGVDDLKTPVHKTELTDAELEAEYRRLSSLSPEDVKAEMRTKGLTPVEERPLLKDSPEAIAKIKAENKAAVERLRAKKKTVEDFTKDDDWDPSGMASGGIARVGMFMGGGLIKLARLKKMFPRIHIDSLLEASRIKDPNKLQKMLNSFRKTEQSIDAAPSSKLFDFDTTGRRPNASGGLANILGV